MKYMRIVLNYEQKHFILVKKGRANYTIKLAT